MLSSLASTILPTKVLHIQKRSKYLNRPVETIRPESGLRTSLRSTLSPSSLGIRHFNEVRTSNNRNRMRRTDRVQNISMKYNMTAEEVNTYEEFAKILANYEPDEMCDILSDVLKDAKALMYK